METIEGLKWDVTGDEVKRLLSVRIEQCDQKAALFEKQAKQQDELVAAMINPEKEFVKNSADQSENLRVKAREYENRSKLYTFLVEHVIKDGVYRLDRQDLHFLGVLEDHMRY